MRQTQYRRGNGGWWVLAFVLAVVAFIVWDQAQGDRIADPASRTGRQVQKGETGESPASSPPAGSDRKVEPTPERRLPPSGIM